MEYRIQRLEDNLKKQARDLLTLLWVNSPASPQVAVSNNIIWATWLVNGQWIEVEVDDDGWYLGSHPIKLTTREGEIGELPSYESLQEYRDMIEYMGTQIVMRAPEKLERLT